jgi:hypothetical protein
MAKKLFPLLLCAFGCGCLAFGCFATPAYAVAPAIPQCGGACMFSSECVKKSVYCNAGVPNCLCNTSGSCECQ